MATKASSKIKGVIILWLLQLGLWILLTLPIEPVRLYLGAGISLLLSLLFFRFSFVFTSVRISFKSAWYMTEFLLVFMTELIKANIDVAFRVLSPTLPLQPGIVEIETKLKSPLGRLVLANAITLTPGTITVDIKGNTYFIHWIDVSAGKNSKEITSRRIIGRFEKYLEVIFG